MTTTELTHRAAPKSKKIKCNVFGALVCMYMIKREKVKQINHKSEERPESQAVEHHLRPLVLINVVSPFQMPNPTREGVSHIPFALTLLLVQTRHKRSPLVAPLTSISTNGFFTLINQTRWSLFPHKKYKKNNDVTVIISY